MNSESLTKVIFFFLFYWITSSSLVFVAFIFIFFAPIVIGSFIALPYDAAVGLMSLKINIREHLKLLIILAVTLLAFFAWLYSINYDYVFAGQWVNQNVKSCNYINNSLLKMNLCYISLASFTFLMTVFCIILPLLFIAVPWLILASIPISYNTLFNPSLRYDDDKERFHNKTNDERRKFFVVLGFLWVLIGYCLIYIYFVSDPWTPLLKLFSPLISHFHFYPYF